jgi:hypothetical protein
MSARSLAPRRRGLSLATALVAMGLAGSAAVLATTGTASAEAAASTATLTLTGVVDSNCPISTGGTTVYVAPGGSIDFKAALAGISVNVTTLLGIPITVALNTSTVAAFSDTLIMDGDTAHPQTVTGTQDYKLSGISGNHTFTWTAASVQLLPSVAGGVTVQLNANNVSLPVGAKLSWNGAISTSKTNTCGISAQLPGVQASAGPIHVSIPPVALPSVTVPALPSLGGLLPGSTPTAGSTGGTATSGNGLGYNDPGQQVPAAVVPKGGGNGLFGEGSNGSGGSGSSGGGANGKNAALTGSGVTASGSPSLANGKTVDLSAKKTSAAQIPVVLAVLAILALSLVSAAYARMYLLRRTTV